MQRNSLSSTHKRFKQRLRQTSGVIDLASIMVGVIIVGVLSTGIVATTFALVPFTQDAAAKKALDSASTAEGAAYVAGDQNRYLAMDDLVAGKWIQASAQTVVGTDADGTCYAAMSLSATGNRFWTDNSTPDIVPYIAGTSASDCVDLDALSDTLVSADSAAAATGVLDAIRDAEDVAYADAVPNEYVDMAGLVAAGLVDESSTTVVEVNPDASGFAAMTVTASGAKYWIDSGSSSVLLYVAGESVSAFYGLADLSAALDAAGSAAPADGASGNTYADQCDTPDAGWQFADSDVEQQIATAIEANTGVAAPSPLLVSDASLLLNSGEVSWSNLNIAGPEVTSLNGIQCAAPYIGGIDVTGTNATDFSPMTAFTEATYFGLYDNIQATQFDASGLTSVENVYISGHVGALGLNLENLPALQGAYIDTNPNLVGLTVSNTPVLEDVYVNDNEINGAVQIGPNATTTANDAFYVDTNTGNFQLLITGQAAPRGLHIYDNPGMTSVTVSDMGAVAQVYVQGNSAVTSVNVSNIPGEIVLWVDRNAALNTLNTSGVALSSLNVSSTALATSVGSDLAAANSLIETTTPGFYTKCGDSYC